MTSAIRSRCERINGKFWLLFTRVVSGVKKVMPSTFNASMAAAFPLQVGQLATISDCTKSVTFQISGIAAGTPSLINFGGAVGPPGNATTSLPVGFASSNWGALASFDAPYPRKTKKIYGSIGNSFVAAVEFGPTVRAKAIMSGG